MDASAMARERFAFLRHEIARIEGRPAETLDGSSGNHAVASDGPAVRQTANLAAVQCVDERQPAQTKPDLIQTGIASFDAALGGGLQRGALSELRCTETRHAASLSGFALCLMNGARAQDKTKNMPLLWLTAAATANETGVPYLPGVAGLTSLSPGQFFTATAKRTEDALWIAEEAAASGAFCGLILELRGNPRSLGLDETRRLQRRAALSGRPVFLLRVAGEAEPTAAPCRLSVGPAPAVLRHTRNGPLPGSIGAAAFTITIEKARAPAVPPFTLEWNCHDRIFKDRTDSPSHSGADVAASVDRPDRPPALGPRVAQARSS